MPIGFIGLGIMGQPMALNLARASVPLVVWNRSPEKAGPLRAAGAAVAATPAEVFDCADTVIMMLATELAIDAALGRDPGTFGVGVAGRLVVNMGTTSPAYSAALDADIRAAGGRYLEAPVSGSRKPAEAGDLVAMLAGAPDDVERVASLLAPICRERVACGQVPAATLMKLAVNTFLIAMVTGLAEAFHFARGHGLDLPTLDAILAAGPMSSSVSRVKGAKLVTNDFEAQAAIADVLKNSRLVAEAARRGGLASPLIDVCHALYAETAGLGLEREDMVAVVRAIEARTAGRILAS